MTELTDLAEIIDGGVILFHPWNKGPKQNCISKIIIIFYILQTA